MIINADITYGIAQKADLRALLALEQSCFDTDRMNARAQRYHIKKGAIRALKNKAGQLLGSAVLLKRKNSCWHWLYSIAINPTHRGKGHAKQLMRAIINETMKSGSCGLYLEVAVSNQKAIVLYQQVGFVVFKRLDAFYENGEDALKMRLFY